MEAGVMKVYCWDGSGSDEKSFSWNGSGTYETNIADMEARVIKICCWIWGGIDETNVAEMEARVKRMFLKWERDWRKECCWNGSGKVYKVNILFCDELSATTCPATNYPRRIVRNPNWVIMVRVNLASGVTDKYLMALWCRRTLPWDVEHL